MTRKCSECEFREDVYKGLGCYPECTNTKRKQNGISLRIKNSPMWCPFKRVARRKRKTSPRAKMVKELDALWRLAVKLIAGNKCEISGKIGRAGRGLVLNAHHIIGRSNYRTRWLVANGALLSPGKHTLNPDSAHQNPLHFLEQMVKKRGKKWYDDLQKEAYTDGGAIKHTMQDLEYIRITLKETIANELKKNQ